MVQYELLHIVTCTPRNAWQSLGGHLHSHNAHCPAPRLGAARGALGRSRPALGGSRRRGSRRREVALLRCAAPRPACRVLHEPRRAQNLQLGRAGGSLGDARVRRGPPCRVPLVGHRVLLDALPRHLRRRARPPPAAHRPTLSRRVARAQASATAPSAACTRSASGCESSSTWRSRGRRRAATSRRAPPSAPLPPSEGSRPPWRAADAARSARAQGSALLRASVPRSARGLLRGRRRVVRLDPPR